LKIHILKPETLSR